MPEKVLVLPCARYGLEAHHMGNFKRIMFNANTAPFTIDSVHGRASERATEKMSPEAKARFRRKGRERDEIERPLVVMMRERASRSSACIVPSQASDPTFHRLEFGQQHFCEFHPTA